MGGKPKDPDYWKKYADRHTEKIKEKSRRQTEKQKAERHKQFSSRPYCSVCGKPFLGRAVASKATLLSGTHFKCDPAVWMTAQRSLKRKPPIG